MSVGSFMSGVMEQVWRLTSVSVPGLGITIKQLFLGLIVLEVSFFILKNLLSLGQGVKGVYDRSNRSRFKSSQSYKAYVKKHSDD